MSTDNFPELIRAIEELNVQQPYQDEAREKLTATGARMLTALKLNAPEGSQSWHPIPNLPLKQNIRPSLRQFGKTLAQSWESQPAVTDLEDGIKMAIEIDHPTYDPASLSRYGGTGIVEWLSRGTREHQIPLRLGPTLVFWWGSPLRWGPTLSSTEGDVGLRREEGVLHSGAVGNNWLDKESQRNTKHFRDIALETPGAVIVRELSKSGSLERI